MTQRTILIADDEQYLTQILSYNVQKTCARTIIARNGAEMCTLAELHLPDLIVSDYQMPTLDGLSACMKLKQNPATANIPIIMLTARGHRLTAQELSLTNIKYVFPKPFSARELIARINQVLGTPRTNIEAAA